MAASEVKRLVEQHLSLVQAIARKVKKSVGASVDVDDLVDYGSKGLEAAASVADESRPAPDLAVEGQRMAARVRRAVGALPDKERRLMELYYFADKNLEEAGAELGLSKSWACRLHARAVELLRVAIE